MKKRTIKAGKFQRHYATNGILMSREQRKLIELAEGTMVTILKIRRQSHLCSVRCVIVDDETGQRALGSGRKAVDTCIAIPVEYLPKMKVPGVEAKAGKGKGTKGAKTKGAALPVVQVEALPLTDLVKGIGAADIAPAPEVAPAPVAVAPAVEAPAPVEAAPAAVEAAV